jgi:F0F1-type ATP synthase assembly protein I
MGHTLPEPLAAEMEVSAIGGERRLIGPVDKTDTFCWEPSESNVQDMTSLAVVLIVIGLIGLFLGIFVEAVKWMLWIGIILLVIGIIAAIMRSIRRNA